MKAYNKKDLKFVNGMIMTEDNDVVGIDMRVAQDLKFLDGALQLVEFLKDKPAPTRPIDIDEFKLHSNFEEKHIAKPFTPNIDEQIEIAKVIMSEIDEVKFVDECNKLMSLLKNLAEWIDDEYVVNSLFVGKLDLPMIGNPLELDAEMFESMIRSVVEANAENKVDMNEAMAKIGRVAEAI